MKPERKGTSPYDEEYILDYYTPVSIDKFFYGASR
jgi:hypothetical protein